MRGKIIDGKIIRNLGYLGGMRINRRWNLSLVFVVIGLSGIALCSCSRDQAAGKSDKAAQYTCPMHPEVAKDRPGDCPKCGMKLVEKK
jgi:hypothetical protein